MVSTIKFYNFGKGWGWIENPNDQSKGYYFHISSVIGELRELFEAKKIMMNLLHLRQGHQR